jgi:hypothetical protein
VQRIIEPLISGPQLDAFPFRHSDIQAIVGPLIVLLREDKGALRYRDKVTQHKRQRQEVPDGGPGFLRRDPPPPVCPQKGTHHFGLEMGWGPDVDDLSFPVEQEFFGRHRMVL